MDDEPHSLEMLDGYLSEYTGEVEVVAMAYSAETAAKEIVKHKPELLFLDISMPGEDGLDLIRKFPNRDFEFVYVTAHESYAVKAFELGAVHYLLKPIDIIQLNEAVARSSRRIRGRSLPGHSTRMHPEKIAIAGTHGHKLVELDNILYLESDGSYTRIILRDGSYLISSRNIGFYEELLEGRGFFRTHRQYLVNLSSVKGYTRGKSGYVELDTGVTVQVSFTKRADFIARLGSEMISGES